MTSELHDDSVFIGLKNYLDGTVLSNSSKTQSHVMHLCTVDGFPYVSCQLGTHMNKSEVPFLQMFTN